MPLLVEPRPDIPTTKIAITSKKTIMSFQQRQGLYVDSCRENARNPQKAAGRVHLEMPEHPFIRDEGLYWQESPKSTSTGNFRGEPCIHSDDEETLPQSDVCPPSVSTSAVFSEADPTITSLTRDFWELQIEELQHLHVLVVNPDAAAGVFGPEARVCTSLYAKSKSLALTLAVELPGGTAEGFDAGDLLSSSENAKRKGTPGPTTLESPQLLCPES
ncbi:MAG: hypothetical protein NXY57DRAFT_965282 [Lentinula lateritia]|nr:MAG: hypothetical protein NXY57DRAFT_965282 [Lentinula lateritia]